MKPKLLLSLALVLSGGLFGCSTIPSKKTADEKSWQTTLRAGATNSIFPTSGSVGIAFITVPADAAKVLESQPPAELVPFLEKLRASQSPWGAGKVNEWLIIVRNGLRGTPGVITSTFTTASGITLTNKIPVYTYADHFLQHTESKP